MTHREYAVTFTIVTDIENSEDVKEVLMKALYTVPTTPYFDYVNVDVVAEPFAERDEEGCCDDPSHCDTRERS